MRQTARGPLFWIRAARAPFFTGSVAPALVGFALAWHEAAAFDWAVGALALIALVCLHAGANLANDYYDHVSGNDEANVAYWAPFTGGSRLIQRGEVRAGEVLAASLVCFAVGGGMGLYLVWAAGWPVLLLGTIGAATGFFYTAPPLKLGYRGLGELAVLLDFGLLPVLGAYYVQAGDFTVGAAAAGAVVGLLMVNVLWINQFQDLEADAAVGKRHWVVRLGRARSAWVHVGLFGAAYGCLLVSIGMAALPGWAALGLVSLPIAVRAAATSLKHHGDLGRLRPANVATVVVHVVTSVGMTVGILLA